MRSVGASVRLYGVAEKDNALNVVPSQRLDGKQVFHGMVMGESSGLGSRLVRTKKSFIKIN